MTPKRTLDTFFQPATTKKARIGESSFDSGPHAPVVNGPSSRHPTYPFPIPGFPSEIQDALSSQIPASDGREIKDQQDLDLLYFQPYIPRSLENTVFEFLRRELFFYRVKYKIKRGPLEKDISTPRFTTVFGVDESSRFDDAGALIDSNTKKSIPTDRYKTCKPRPIPACLDHLRQLTEVFTGSTYNFCLVNYYASGEDSISYHSDDERFLGPDPAIASFSLGAKRDFLMKHKPVIPKHGEAEPDGAASQGSKPLSLPLASGDMILMRGKTQANWLHSIPKRKRGEADKGRINITFRRAMVRGGTENYYQYNVGRGEVYKWNGESKEMKPWAEGPASQKN